MAIKVTCVVPDRDAPAKTDIKVNSDWADERRIEIVIGDEKRVVEGSDLIRAIKNCINTGRA